LRERLDCQIFSNVYHKEGDAQLSEASPGVLPGALPDALIESLVASFDSGASPPIHAVR